MECLKHQSSLLSYKPPKILDTILSKTFLMGFGTKACQFQILTSIKLRTEVIFRILLFSWAFREMRLILMHLDCTEYS